MHSAEAVITLETEMEHPFPNPPRSAVGIVPVLLPRNADLRKGLGGGGPYRNGLHWPEARRLC